MDNIEIVNCEAYRKVLEHRQTCEKWMNGFCLGCFGGGLTKFLKDALKGVGE